MSVLNHGDTAPSVCSSFDHKPQVRPALLALRLPPSFSPSLPAPSLPACPLPGILQCLNALAGGHRLLAEKLPVALSASFAPSLPTFFFPLSLLPSYSSPLVSSFAHHLISPACSHFYVFINVPFGRLMRTCCTLLIAPCVEACRHTCPSVLQLLGLQRSFFLPSVAHP